jgi:hypothetical protein
MGNTEGVASFSPGLQYSATLGDGVEVGPIAIRRPQVAEYGNLGL